MDEMKSEFKEKYYALKDWLRNYRELDKEVKNTLKILDQYEATMTSIGSPVLSDMPKAKGGIGDRTSEAVVRKMEIEEDLELAIQERDNRKAEIKGYIRKLKKADERMVINLRFIGMYDTYDTTSIMFGDEPDFLAKEESYSRRVLELQKNALQNMVSYLDSIGKDPREMKEMI